MNRMPVRFKNRPLMPMKGSRVRKFVDSGRGRIRFDRKIKVHYLQLLVDPSGYEKQEIVIGLDPGSTFDGISVVSKECCHLNIELIQRPKRGKTSIKTFKNRQASNRRIRRSRLRHRRARFNHRTKVGLVPTIRANVEFRQWMIKKLLRIFPISKVVIEDVRFNHYAKKNGKTFSHVEQGKTELYEFVRSQSLKSELFQGFDTKKLRVNSFGVDQKSKEKDLRSFEAHCLDSFVLGCPKGYFDPETGELFDQVQEGLEPIICFNGSINNRVIFIEKIVKIRRQLTRTRSRFNDFKRYYVFRRGGVKEYVVRYGKRNICRVKPEGQSNHPKHWKYIDLGRSEKVKSSTAAYGGTRTKGKTFFRYGEWQNRMYSVKSTNRF